MTYRLSLVVGLIQLPERCLACRSIHLRQVRIHEGRRDTHPKDVSVPAIHCSESPMISIALRPEMVFGPVRSGLSEHQVQDDDQDSHQDCENRGRGSADICGALLASGYGGSPA